jgi:hypothetical protein
LPYFSPDIDRIGGPINIANPQNKR